MRRAGRRGPGAAGAAAASARAATASEGRVIDGEHESPSEAASTDDRGQEAAPAEPARRRSAGRDLRLAVASGLVLAAALLGALFTSPVLLLAFVGALIVIALLELDVAFRQQGVRPATPVAGGAGLVMLFGAYWVGPSAQALGVLLLLFGAVLWVFLGTDRRRVVPTVSATLLAGLWVPFLASHLALLLARQDGEWAVLAVIALAVSSDIGAYGVGSAFGRHKLAPRVSPAKSWEGLAGGLATVLVLAALVTARLPGFDLPTALLLGVVVVPAATLGDLTESLVKRDLGVKDLGSVVPGHGGIMDRVDSILLALPAAHLLLLALGG
ncbi:MAG: phosphatidate cytidylyltransferase [Egibacteraceae bacterium]